MIDFKNKSELMVFGAMVLLTLIWLVCVSVIAVKLATKATKKKGAFLGVIFFILSIVVMLASFLALLVVGADYLPNKISEVVLDGNALIIYFFRKIGFKIPVVGFFVRVMLKAIVIPLLACALFILSLLFLILMPKRWKKNRTRFNEEDGSGYVSVNEEETTGAGVDYEGGNETFAYYTESEPEIETETEIDLDETTEEISESEELYEPELTFEQELFGVSASQIEQTLEEEAAKEEPLAEENIETALPVEEKATEETEEVEELTEVEQSDEYERDMEEDIILPQSDTTVEQEQPETEETVEEAEPIEASDDEDDFDKILAKIESELVSQDEAGETFGATADEYETEEPAEVEMPVADEFAEETFVDEEPVTPSEEESESDGYSYEVIYSEEENTAPDLSYQEINEDENSVEEEQYEEPTFVRPLAPVISDEDRAIIEEAFSVLESEEIGEPAFDETSTEQQSIEEETPVAETESAHIATWEETLVADEPTEETTEETIETVEDEQPLEEETVEEEQREEEPPVAETVEVEQPTEETPEEEQPAEEQPEEEQPAKAEMPVAETQYGEEVENTANDGEERINDALDALEKISSLEVSEQTETKNTKVLDFGDIVYKPRTVYKKPTKKAQAKAVVKPEPIIEPTVEPKVEKPQKSHRTVAKSGVGELFAQYLAGKNDNEKKKLESALARVVVNKKDED